MGLQLFTPIHVWENFVSQICFSFATFETVTLQNIYKDIRNVCGITANPVLHKLQIINNTKLQYIWYYLL